MQQRPKSLGEFELMVMAAVLHLGDEAYGVSIIDELEKRAGRKTSVGALYATLSRLETKGLVETRLGEATAERGGRAKKYVSVTSAGRGAFNDSANALQQMLQGLTLAPTGAGS